MNYKELDPNQIINSFKANNTELYDKMKQTDHDCSLMHPNEYHSEGSVWAHTCMVISNLLDNFISFSKIDNKLILAALLHDIGKPFVIAEKKGIDNIPRMTTYGHEGIGTFIALDAINKMNDIEIEKSDLINILRLINLHMIFYNIFKSQKSNDDELISQFKNDLPFLNSLKQLLRADMFGRITSIKEYEKSLMIIKYLDQINDKMKGNDNEIKKDKNKLNKFIMMIGVPGTGKTTYTQHFLSKNKNYISLCRDSLIEDNLNNCKYSSYEDSFKDLEFQKYIDNELNSRLDNYIKNNRNIIIDMTNISRKSRRSKLSKISDKSYYKIAEVFIKSYSDIFDVNEKRKCSGEHFIPSYRLTQMMSSFKFPLHDEFDEINIHIN